MQGDMYYVWYVSVHEGRYAAAAHHLLSCPNAKDCPPDLASKKPCQATSISRPRDLTAPKTSSVMFHALGSPLREGRMDGWILLIQKMSEMHAVIIT